MSLYETGEIWEAGKNLPLSLLFFFFPERLNKRAFKSCGTIRPTQEKNTHLKCNGKRTGKESFSFAI